MEMSMHTQVIDLMARLDKAEFERDELLNSVKEWACDDCNYVYPSSPQNGFKCVICPRCNGKTMPHESLKRLRAERERDELRAKLAEMEKCDFDLKQIVTVPDLLSLDTIDAVHKWKNTCVAIEVNKKIAEICEQEPIYQYKNPLTDSWNDVDKYYYDHCIATKRIVYAHPVPAHDYKAMCDELLEALKYHQKQTRPTQRTIDAIAKAEKISNNPS